MNVVNGGFAFAFDSLARVRPIFVMSSCISISGAVQVRCQYRTYAFASSAAFSHVNAEKTPDRLPDGDVNIHMDGL